MMRKWVNILRLVKRSVTGSLCKILLTWKYRRRKYASNATIPHLQFSRPGKVFLAGEPIMVSVFNPDEIPLEIVTVQVDPDIGNKILQKLPWRSNPATIKLPGFTGKLQIFARESDLLSRFDKVRSNSVAARVVDASEENVALIDADRLSEHKMQCAVQVSSTGVLTLHDPWIIPGNAGFPEHGQWFPTPVWEGCTPLYNEEAEYYADPMRYFLDCIEQLRAKGFDFVTWHDLMDSKVSLSDSSILLQLDVDGGPRSFLRMAKALADMGIRATGMLHRRARHWYEYDFEDTDLAELKELQHKGWAFGYHHNALTNLSGFTVEDAVDEKFIDEAAQILVRDVNELRQELNIRTLTHHGGNQLNHRVPIAEEAQVTCVDRKFSPDLWRPIKRSFSDGSFTSRPGSLQSFVESATKSDGILFMRCHPFKYGNYPDGLDLGPLTESKADLPEAGTLAEKCNAGAGLSRIEKQSAWLNCRAITRDGIQLGYASYQKPLSAMFVDNEEINAGIERLRKRRQPGFLRQYPWAEGDPRVIWWRLLSSFCGPGRVLNVGAMPPDQKDETLAFLKPGSTLLEVDIDPERKPDIIADFCDPDYSIDRRFDHVLLNGLPYFSDPEIAISNAATHLIESGSLLIGAAAASHPERGGLFRPDDRPIWRRGMIERQGESLSLTTMLWSFDKTSIDQLMCNWPGTWQAEFIFHYWFIVARR